MARTISLIGKTLVATSLAFFAGPALSQTYPSQPIRLIVPFSPGGGTDTFARVVSAGMQSSLGQNIIVECSCDNIEVISHIGTIGEIDIVD